MFDVTSYHVCHYIHTWIGACKTGYDRIFEGQNRKLGKLFRVKWFFFHVSNSWMQFMSPLLLHRLWFGSYQSQMLLQPPWSLRSSHVLQLNCLHWRLRISFLLIVYLTWILENILIIGYIIIHQVWNYLVYLYVRWPHLVRQEQFRCGRRTWKLFSPMRIINEPSSQCLRKFILFEYLRKILGDNFLRAIWFQHDPTPF